MKNTSLVFIFTALFLQAILFPSSVSGAASQESGAVFTEVEGKDWFLSEVKSAGKTIRIDRRKLEAGNLSGAFSINFQKGQASGESRLSGMGAPNRYFGPYTAGPGKALKIGSVASTMMMPLKEPEGLNESEFFGYLHKAGRWDIRAGKLEIHSSDSNGREVLLVFTDNR